MTLSKIVQRAPRGTQARHLTPTSGSSQKLNIILSRNSTELAKRAAILISSRILENPKLNIAIAVGQQPQGIFSNLVDLIKEGTVDVSGCHFFILDEFFGQTQEETVGSHRKELEESFFSRLPQVPTHHVHSPNVKLQPEQAQKEYQEMLKLKPVDIIIAAVGPNGNIGWLDNMDDPKACNVVDLTKANSYFSKGYDRCVALGAQVFWDAKEVILVARGQNKARIIEHIIKEDMNGKTPVAAFLRDHPHISLFLEPESASCILQDEKKSIEDISGFSFLQPSTSIVNKKILCFSPHPDDTSISAGATLAMLAPNNDVVSVVATTGHRAFIPNAGREERIEIREEEATAEATILGARSHFLRLPLYDRSSRVEEDDIIQVVKYLKESNPDMIFLPQTGDSHQTHRAVAKAILLAIQQLLLSGSTDSNRSSYNLYMYEGPWSLFQKGCYNVISMPQEDCFGKKLAAIAAHKSQTDRTAYDVASDCLSQLRAALVPEQDLAGFGAAPPEVGSRVELFYHVSVKNVTEVQVLIELLDSQTPPKARV